MFSYKINRLAKKLEHRVKEYFSDILYKVSLSDTPAYLYMLFEHGYFCPKPRKVQFCFVPILLCKETHDFYTSYRGSC